MVQDALDEWREAVDFCRYYALQATQTLVPTRLPGPTGETNELHCLGRGIILCISPWNFPLAIFTGQIMAALVAGNAVVAKPAEQTSLIAQRLHALWLEAGLPAGLCQLVLGEGELLGPVLCKDARVDGVMFTGSTAVSKIINRCLAQRETGIVPLIAETGGQNAMLVDSSALPEQVVESVLQSAFGAAGQRCSALRVLYIQEDVYDIMVNMLKGAMALLRVGLPTQMDTDVGPVIDAEALAVLQAHRTFLETHGQHIATTPCDQDLLKQGHFFAPCAYENTIH